MSRHTLYFAGAAIAVLGLGSLDSLRAEEGGSWTNRAGHVLKASPLAIRGQTVTLVQDNTGKPVDYPLSLFPMQEQERLRSCLKQTTIPEGLQSAYEFSGRAITRSRLLYENGSISKENYRESLEKNLSAFRAQAAPFILQKKLSPERLELILAELAGAK